RRHWGGGHSESRLDRASALPRHRERESLAVFAPQGCWSDPKIESQQLSARLAAVVAVKRLAWVLEKQAQQIRAGRRGHRHAEDQLQRLRHRRILVEFLELRLVLRLFRVPEIFR